MYKGIGTVFIVYYGNSAPWDLLLSGELRSYKMDAKRVLPPESAMKKLYEPKV